MARKNHDKVHELWVGFYKKNSKPARPSGGKTGITYSETIQDKSSFYYRSDLGAFESAGSDNYSYKWPSGGYLSTPSDLTRFGNSLLLGKLVSQKKLDLLFTSQKTNDGKETGTGYGFRIGTDYKGRKIVHHGGARAFFLIYPQEKLSVAIIANVFHAPLFEGEAETIAGYFLNDYTFTDGILPSKTFKYSTVIDKTETKGEINIKGNKGSISNFNNATIPIEDIVKDDNGIRIIALSREGIVNIWLRKNELGYTGNWGYDKPTTTISIE